MSKFHKNNKSDEKEEKVQHTFRKIKNSHSIKQMKKIDRELYRIINHNKNLSDIEEIV